MGLGAGRLVCCYMYSCSITMYFLWITSYCTCTLSQMNSNRYLFLLSFLVLWGLLFHKWPMSWVVSYHSLPSDMPVWDFWKKNLPVICEFSLCSATCQTSFPILPLCNVVVNETIRYFVFTYSVCMCWLVMHVPANLILLWWGFTGHLIIENMFFLFIV